MSIWKIAVASQAPSRIFDALETARQEEMHEKETEPKGLVSLSRPRVSNSASAYILPSRLGKLFQQTWWSFKTTDKEQTRKWNVNAASSLRQNSIAENL